MPPCRIRRPLEVLVRYAFPHGETITASFGVASLPEELFLAADEALYAAKRAGKNVVVATGPVARVT